MSITTVNVNHAPVLDPNKSPTNIPQTGDLTEPVDAVGVLVSQLIDKADTSTRLYFQSTSGTRYGLPGVAHLTFRAWDRTSGINGGTANTTPNGGTTAFSLSSENATISVPTIY